MVKVQPSAEQIITDNGIIREKPDSTSAVSVPEVADCCLHVVLLPTVAYRNPAENRGLKPPEGAQVFKFCGQKGVKNAFILSRCPAVVPVPA
jgi:hypothetical protein